MVRVDGQLCRGTSFQEATAGLIGGVATDVIDDVHPDNLELCVEAAMSMRLTMAGVDFISEDISVPWHQNGAVVCEVNAQPQLGITHPEIYADVLKSYVNSFPDVEIIVSNKFEKDDTPLFNKNREKVVVSVNPKTILNKGCPTQYFSALTFRNDVSEEERNYITRICVSSFPQNDSP